MASVKIVADLSRPVVVDRAGVVRTRGGYGIACMGELTVFILAVLVLLLVNTTGVLLAVVQLPGTWLILLGTALVAWWGGEREWLGWGVLGGLLLVAVLGELIEFLAGAWGARRAGASRRATWLALLGGIVGGLVGLVVLIFIPLFGALIGAAIGAAAGSMLGDWWAGRAWEPVLSGGKGAFWGKFWGALAKVGLACVMWLVALVAMLWP